MNHGIATIKSELLGLDGNVLVEVGEEGIVTAYLPEDKTFAVMFTNDRWYTFSEPEEAFLERFDIKKD
jgi:hypothetical protein